MWCCLCSSWGRFKENHMWLWLRQALNGPKMLKDGGCFCLSWLSRDIQPCTPFPLPPQHKEGCHASRSLDCSSLFWSVSNIFMSAFFILIHEFDTCLLCMTCSRVVFRAADWCDVTLVWACTSVSRYTLDRDEQYYSTLYKIFRFFLLISHQKLLYPMWIEAGCIYDTLINPWSTK